MKTGITIVRCIYNNRIVIGVDTRTTKEHIATDLLRNIALSST